MSREYCFECDQNIETDYQLPQEHKEMHCARRHSSDFIMDGICSDLGLFNDNVSEVAS